jgi:hypothetical protein
MIMPDDVKFSRIDRLGLARWVVAMRRAHAAGVRQGRGHLLDRTGAYCCLGLYCEIGEAYGALTRSIAMGNGDASWSDVGGLPNSTLLPRDIQPVGMLSGDIYIINQLNLDEQRDGKPLQITATHANDAVGFTFAQIADCVEWTYQLDAAELAAAEAMPRVPAIEPDDTDTPEGN